MADADIAMCFDEPEFKLLTQAFDRLPRHLSETTGVL